MKTLAQLIGTDITTADTVPAEIPAHVIFAASGDEKQTTPNEDEAGALIASSDCPRIVWIGTEEYMVRLGGPTFEGVTMVLNGSRLYCFGASVLERAIIGMEELVDKAASQVVQARHAIEALTAIKDLNGPAAESARGELMKTKELKFTNTCNPADETELELIEEWHRGTIVDLRQSRVDVPALAARLADAEIEDSTAH